MNGLASMTLTDKVNLYRQFDEARHADLENFADEFQSMKLRLATLEADLDDERTSRRSWRQRAELAEQSVGRNKFAVVLIDGDGYHFNRGFYNSAAESGGAQAAHSLYTEVQNYLRIQNDSSDNDIEVMAIVYFNQKGLMHFLTSAEIIPHPTHFSDFFWSFTSSHSLFQAIDCGPGKERADAKLRDTYRFFANNAQCKHIFLACCHDNGYVAELDKYRHDPVAAPKTILIRHGNTGNQFYSLGLPLALFNKTFEMDPIQPVRRFETTPTFLPKAARVPSNSDDASQNSDTVPSTAATWSTVTASAPRLPIRTNTNTNSSLSVSADTFAPFEPTKVSKAATGDSKTGIPVNRAGQRVDRRLQAPSSTDLDRFEERINNQKLCNTYHLTSAGCYSYNCKYDHEPIDDKMRHTLKYKARSIPCTTGHKCRKAECFYGHQCPWGRDKCTNGKCAFYKNGLHDIDDLEIAKFVPAQG